MDKFLKKVAHWNSPRHPIHISYVDAIGIDLKVLEFCLELDREKYERKLLEPRYPKYVNVRSGIYTVSYVLPFFCEVEAISYVQESIIAGESKAPFYIDYTDFLTIKIISGEKPVYLYQFPGLVRKKDSYIFTEVKTEI